MNKKNIIMWLIPIFTLFVVKFMIVLVVQPSIPMGFYFKSPVRNLKKGDTVLFQIDEQYQRFFKNDKIKLNYIAKKIVATDRIRSK